MVVRTASTSAHVDDPNSRAALTLRQIEAEVSLRGMHEALVMQREADVLYALESLNQLLQNNPPLVAERVLDDLEAWMQQRETAATRPRGDGGTAQCRLRRDEHSAGCDLMKFCWGCRC